jgi:hypothetical protein
MTIGKKKILVDVCVAVCDECEFKAELGVDGKMPVNWWGLLEYGLLTDEWHFCSFRCLRYHLNRFPADGDGLPSHPSPEQASGSAVRG